MSLFRKAGKKFEETKRTLIADETGEYICRSCREAVAKDYEYCPHCGEDTIEPAD